MEQQRERPPEPETTEEHGSSEALPPPPTAFPIEEFSRFQAQLLDTPVTNQSSASLQTDSDGNPFGSSSAVSRGSFASTMESQQGNPFRGEGGDEQSFRDDASSLAPPPEYEELQGFGEAMHGGLNGGPSADAPLPSYTVAVGEAARMAEKQGGQGATATATNTRPAIAATDYPEEKPAHGKEQDISDQRQHQEPRKTQPRTHQRDPAELSAITDAIACAYASSPALASQRFSRSVPQTTSQSETANYGEEGAFDTQAGPSHAGIEEKGKRRESQNSTAEKDVVMIEGRRMSRTMAAELFQMWDNIDRAHGNRESFGISLRLCYVADGRLRNGQSDASA